MGKGYQKGGYQEERQYGKHKGRGKARDDSRLRRDDSIERRYNAPPSATSINATAFILCLSLYVRSIIVPIKEQLQSLECFVKFSKWLFVTILKVRVYIWGVPNQGAKLADLKNQKKIRKKQKKKTKKNNYFTSSDPHHDMLGGGCQVRVVIENMMGRMENLRTLISGFLGLVILVRWALVTMFLS